MRIAYILSTFPSLSETFILREVTELRRRGMDVGIFALTRGDASVLHADAEELLDNAVFRPPVFSWRVRKARLQTIFRRPRAWFQGAATNLARVAAPGFGLRQAVGAIWSAAYFASEMRQLGIEHIHAGWSDYPARVAYLASRFTDLTFSFSAHARDIFVNFSPFWQEHLRRAEFVTVCTEHGRRFIEERLGCESAKLHRIYHGVDIAAFDALLRQAGGEPSGAPIVLAVGRDAPKKGFHVLAQACELLRARGVSFRAVIIGPRRPDSPASCGGSSAGVDWTGPKPQADVAEAMSEATALVVPSVIADDGDHDGLPNVILEAMATRLPVVASSVGGIPEAVIDGETGLLVEPGNATELADKIEVLLKDGGLRRTLGDGGRRLVEDRFDLTKNVDRLAALLGQAIGSRTP